MIYLFCFILSFVFCFIFINISPSIGLVDLPDIRKRHKGSIPIVGGIAVFISFFLSIYIFDVDFKSINIYFFCSLLLLVIGVIDDRNDLNFKVRLAVETIASLLMVFLVGLNLRFLGNMLFNYYILIPAVIGVIVTIIAVIGSINAFNMVDGIDGLLASLAIVSLSFIGYLFYCSNNIQVFKFCEVFILVLIPFLLFNLGLLGSKNKIFMGDAGSIFIGFTLIWL